MVEMCYNTSCLDLQMGAFFMPNNQILRGKVATITLGKRPVNLDNLRSSGGYFAYEVEMTKGNGIPCEKCGTSEWYDSGNCKRCSCDASMRWRKNNPEKSREADRRFKLHYKIDPEKHRKQTRDWARENPDKTRASVQNWRIRNPEKMASYKHNRRTRKTEAGGSYTAAEWKALCKQYNYRCLSCGKKTQLTADHVIPVIAGGTSDISNIQPLCKSCNSIKHDKTTDYRTKPGIKRWVQKRLFNG